MPDPRPLRPDDPERLGDYRLIGLLGEGGQGVVYLGERIDDTKPSETDSSDAETADGEDGTARPERFAIKLLRTHLSGDERARRYFARELAAAQRIDPSFTAHIVEADVEGRTPYIVSEYVDGRALSDIVRERGPLSGAELHDLAIGTLRALAAIHQANVVHRDFKPSNVLLGAGRPRVIDFGIARALDSTMSMTSGIVGTPAYMAPEQLNGHRLTPAVDVFAWGATMVFAATGRSPFGHDSIPATMNRILSGDPDIGTIASPLRELVWYCMYKDPAHRPTVARLLTDLGEATAAPGVPSPAPAPAPRPAVLPAPASPWGAGPGQWESGWQSLPPDAPPPSQSPWGAPPRDTTPPPRVRKNRRWVPAVAASVGVALVAAASVAVVRLVHDGEHPDPGPTETAVAAPAADAALTKVVNPSTAKGGTLKLAQADDFDSLDPADMYFAGSWNISRLYARSLLTYRAGAGAAALRPVPDLASGPGQSSDDLKTWTYKLRTGVKFDDGTPVTAKDVRYAVARTFATEVHYLGPTYFRQMLDAGSYAGPYKDHDLDDFHGVTTPDDQTVVFHLKKPFADFDSLAALPQTAPVPAAKDDGAQYKNHPASTGPYKFESYSPGKSLSLVRNPAWSPDGIRTQLPDRVEVQFGLAADAVDQQLLGGRAELNPNGVGLSDAARAKALADPSLTKNTDSLTSGYLRYIALSTKVAPFDNVHCRRAVQYAVDRTAAQTADGGPQGAEIATNLAPPVLVGRQKFDQYPASADKARQELAACGKPSGFSATMAIRQDRPKDMAVAEAVQGALRRAGISVKIQPYDAARFYTEYAGKPSYAHAHDLGMILSVWGPDFPTAAGFFPLLVDGRQILPTGNNNLAELNDSTINGLLDQADQAKDQKTREGLTARIDQAVMATGAIVPLVYDKVVLYRGTRLTNAAVSPVYVGYDLATAGVG
ncbi:ABC transporter substrate-binding protein [Actinoallomurus sp. NBC_01490]|uniref:ABC transporter substrate-binding protein n=1 Tax=Actinoallomurus sp. NBC_01490 TaxID=2903557 RepID=UPI002E33723C|nr:ABC transporter substrate-binding protein [Actinoallomurus sp. NBC_01490]